MTRAANAAEGRTGRYNRQNQLRQSEYYVLSTGETDAACDVTRHHVATHRVINVVPPSIIYIYIYIFFFLLPIPFCIIFFRTVLSNKRFFNVFFHV